MDLDNLSPSAREHFEETINRLNLIKELADDLKTNPKYQDFFSKYQPSGVENFIRDYSVIKANWILHHNSYRKSDERKQSELQKDTIEKFWEIQQKKLFNIQCRWRAEEIKIPEIKISYDFEFWAYNIDQCPFLTPVSQDEFDLYYEYMLSDEFFKYGIFPHHAQEYDSIKEDYNSVDNKDEQYNWYRFYDERMGTSSLLLLPDIRGQKENFYVDLYRKDDREKNPERYKPGKPAGLPNFNYYNDESIENFISLFEEPKLKEYFRVYQKDEGKFNYHYEVDDSPVYDAIETLKNSDDVELVLKGNWRDTLLATAGRCEQKLMAVKLSSVYRDYLYRLKTGISFDMSHLDNFGDSIKHSNSFWRDCIIKGRVLNNEPPDFNF